MAAFLYGYQALSMTGVLKVTPCIKPYHSLTSKLSWSKPISYCGGRNLNKQETDWPYSKDDTLYDFVFLNYAAFHIVT